MADMVTSIRLNVEEAVLVAREAKRLGVYQHGLLRAAIRFALGLPINRELRESFEAASARERV